MARTPMDSSAAHSAIQNLKWYWGVVATISGLALIDFWLLFLLVLWFPAYLVAEFMELRTRKRLHGYAARHQFQCCPKCAYPLGPPPLGRSDNTMLCTECGRVYYKEKAAKYWTRMTKARAFVLFPWFASIKPRSITEIEPPDPTQELMDEDEAL